MLCWPACWSFPKVGPLWDLLGSRAPRSCVVASVPHVSNVSHVSHVVQDNKRMLCCLSEAVRHFTLL